MNISTTEAAKARVKELEAKLQAIENFIEGVRLAARDKNPAGVTILDFLAVWNEQLTVRADAADSRVKALEAQLAEVTKAGEATYHVLLNTEAERDAHVKDLADIDIAFRKLCETVLSKEVIYGDSYGVPGILDLAALLVGKAEEVAALKAEVESLKPKVNTLLCKVIDDFMRDALVAIAGAVCTPEKGYIEDGGLQLLLSDIKRLRQQHDIAEQRFSALVAKGTCGWYDDQYAKIQQLEAEVERLRRELGECDIPITEDWLRSVGFKPKQYQGEDAALSLKIPSGAIGDNQWIELCDVTNGVFLLCRWADSYDEGMPPDRVCVEACTRGQLVTLCRALGIPLKPAASEGGEG